MTEKLIQLRVDDDVREKADEVFKHQGLTTQGALKIFLTHVANSGDSPFSKIFDSHQ
ncbi:type II toxin-antitoxin system RelB/DinJ family antitoxin [Weissella diestrammenae]|uniref:Type II toxin-antitoxin system RelB/DinJ family antitoxin n=1 Tax=Weissella diestrammenae TaxID=1162633 RepID=A0A7G9T5N3_9LACO|nr:type II toxin-antitoxin system RelB/DinJ family antitoxin [Weissella diestrammenae]MCM0582234.1 type II toxin-antitoxin system RelB/DinJ family antitoxin [Weissella diestrammenae]QNN75408.1 type II toxin-antitoxin system RelB/DinJ family antitoxin [Weissella diestrammenae]